MKAPTAEFAAMLAASAKRDVVVLVGCYTNSRGEVAPLYANTQPTALRP